MNEFDLLLSPVSEIDENGNAILNGTIANLTTEGGEVTLDINWGDPLSPDNMQMLTIQDGSPLDQDGMKNGVIEFSLSHQYLDDNPTGTLFDPYTISVDAEEEFLIGTDAVFVIDVSGSTGGIAQGVSVGDQNGDSQSDRILDAEIAAFLALNDDLINRGLGNDAKVSVAIYGSNGALLDLDPVAQGTQTFTNPSADKNQNGQLDVEEALKRLRYGGQLGGPTVGSGSTNFEAGLIQAITAVNNAETDPGEGNVIFLSDGFQNDGGVFTDEAFTISNTLGQNLRAFGVGSGSSLDDLDDIDPNAQKFTNIQDLLDLFSGTGGGTNQDSASTSVIVYNVAPTITDVMVESIIIDDDDDYFGSNDDWDDDEGLLITIDVTFTDPGSLDTHTGEAVWSDGVSTDLKIVDFDGFTGTFTTSRFLSEDELEDNFPEIDDDDKNFPGLDDDDIFKLGVNLTITDDDTATDTKLFEFFAVEEEGIFVPDGDAFV